MIKSLTLRATTKTVGHGHRLPDVVHGVQIGKDVILETVTFVTMNMSWNTTEVEPFVNQDLCAVKYLLVVCNEDLSELGKSISQYNTSSL